jgi:hypothetical protein
MAIQREFYRSARGPTVADEDWWCLVFDPETNRLFVRYEWQATGHSGVDEFEIGEFLEQEGAARDALVDDLFRSGSCRCLKEPSRVRSAPPM